MVRVEVVEAVAEHRRLDDPMTATQDQTTRCGLEEVAEYDEGIYEV